MSTWYARSIGRDRQSVLVEKGIVVKQYMRDDWGFTEWGNPELIGQPEASLQALGFEPVPGPLKRQWGSWVSLTPEELEKDEKERRDFFEKSRKEALKVSGTTIELYVPKFYPTLGKEDWHTIEKWGVSEGDIVQAGDFLVTIECCIGFFDIPVPPQANKSCRMKRICIPAGGSTHLGELVVVLERSVLDFSQQLPQEKAEPTGQE